jgi:hypothetical protein
MMDYDFPGDDCTHCEMDYFKLIDHLINDIQHLSSEVVRLRHLLSWHLPEHVGETIRGESLSDLHDSYFEHTAYTNFVSSYCSGNDPLESEGYIEHMMKLYKGEESALFRSLTF